MRNPSKIDESTRTEIYNKYQWKCFWCEAEIVRCNEERPNRATIDHLQPKSKGGTNSIHNMVASCYDCNTRKGNRFPISRSLSRKLVKIGFTLREISLKVDEVARLIGVL